MKTLVDVVNFNSDASCLSTAEWFRILDGGNRSLLCRWLNLYVEKSKKLVLGLPGATIADMASFNPEAIEVIQSWPEIFQLIIRPFSHDIALLRTPAGFQANVELGLRAIRKEFGEPAPYYLPPEFMLTNEQISFLGSIGVRGTFINASRFASDIQSRIPRRPYLVRGVFGGLLGCIPFVGDCTAEYLASVHLFDISGWNSRIIKASEEIVFSWRDGESAFLVPDAVRREAFWLENEEDGIRREHLGDDIDYAGNDSLGNTDFHSYPVHSFLPWMREFRMLSFVNRVMRLEESLPENCRDERLFSWLQTSGSDILSAIEKRAPHVRIRNGVGEAETGFTIMRSERGFEGEEFLLLAEACMRQGELLEAPLSPVEALHHRRYCARMKYLHALCGSRSG